MVKIVNGTEHSINFYRVEDCDQSNPRKLVLKAGAEPFYTIPPGVDLNCVKTNGSAPSLDVPFELVGAVKFTDADPIPDADLIIVSNLYRSACKELGRDTSRLATINGAVYDSAGENPRPCGCLGLAVG